MKTYVTTSIVIIATCLVSCTSSSLAEGTALSHDDLLKGIVADFNEGDFHTRKKASSSLVMLIKEMETSLKHLLEKHEKAQGDVKKDIAKRIEEHNKRGRHLIASLNQLIAESSEPETKIRLTEALGKARFSGAVYELVVQEQKVAYYPFTTGLSSTTQNNREVISAEMYINTIGNYGTIDIAHVRLAIKGMPFKTYPVKESVPVKSRGGKGASLGLGNLSFNFDTTRGNTLFKLPGIKFKIENYVLIIDGKRFEVDGNRHVVFIDRKGKISKTLSFKQSKAKTPKQ